MTAELRGYKREEKEEKHGAYIYEPSAEHWQNALAHTHVPGVALTRQLKQAMAKSWDGSPRDTRKESGGSIPMKTTYDDERGDESSQQHCSRMATT